MQKKKDVDVVDKILDACYKSAQFPLFIMSLMHQYEQRGSLSKKQLQGLYYKAEKVPDVPSGWLATLEAKIAKMPNRFKSETPAIVKPLYEKNERIGKMIEDILANYPQHKHVLFLQTKYNNNELISASEIAELERFAKLLL